MGVLIKWNACCLTCFLLYNIIYDYLKLEPCWRVETISLIIGTRIKTHRKGPRTQIWSKCRTTAIMITFKSLRFFRESTTSINLTLWVPTVKAKKNTSKHSLTKKPWKLLSSHERLTLAQPVRTISQRDWSASTATGFTSRTCLNLPIQLPTIARTRWKIISQSLRTSKILL